MCIFILILLSISTYSFTLLKDEVKGLSTKSRIIFVDTPVLYNAPTLRHAIQNDYIITLLITRSTEHTRKRNIKDNSCTYSARFLEDNSSWETIAAEKSFYELIAKHRLEDKTPEQIISSCIKSPNALRRITP